MEKEMAITPVFLPGKSHGQTSLVGYSPWGHKESDTTEQLTWKKINFHVLFYFFKESNRCCSVQFSCLVVSNSLRPCGLQHTRLPCPSPTPGTYSNPCSSSWWCHPTISSISSSVVLFSSCPQSFPASGSFPMSKFFASSGQSIGVSASASAFPVNIQDWFPLGLTGCCHV